MSTGDVFPGFDRPVPRDGYAWWYLDALSDDGRHALTVIVFVGSVFSPYYAGARRRGDGDPAHHCAVNVALYGAGGKRWCLTERGRGQLARDATRLRIGPSAVRWERDVLIVDVDEVTVPWPSRIRGRITVHPSALTGHTAVLDAAGRHRWSPVAPRARVELRLQHPDLAWNGDGYLDSNAGEEPLERGFRCWDWSRASLRDGAALLYDVVALGNQVVLSLPALEAIGGDLKVRSNYELSNISFLYNASCELILKIMVCFLIFCQHHYS